jgi:hypothetical protein
MILPKTLTQTATGMRRIVQEQQVLPALGDRPALQELMVPMAQAVGI